MQNVHIWTILLAAGVCAACVIGCSTASHEEEPSAPLPRGGVASGTNTGAGTDTSTKMSFGSMPDGTPVDLYTLRNHRGMEVRIINYGGAIVSLKVPDRNGKLDDVVLGFDTLDDY